MKQIKIKSVLIYDILFKSKLNILINKTFYYKCIILFIFIFL